MNSGAILTALLLGVLIAVVAAWLIGGLYRRRMLALMRLTPNTPAARGATTPGTQTPSQPRTPLPGAHRLHRAMRRQMLALTGVGLLIGLTHAALALALLYGEGLLTPGRWLTLGLVYAWPLVLTWGLLWRWSWTRTWLAVGVYLLVMLLLVRWRSVEPLSLGSSAGWLAGLVALPAVVSLLIGASGRIRAIAPYLLPIGLLWSAGTLAVQLWQLDGLGSPPAWLLWLVGVLGAWPSIVLLAVLPWLVLAWPAWWLARVLAQAYQAQRFSDLGFLVAAYWAVVLSASALPSLQGSGWVGLVTLLPWLWLPLMQWAMRAWLRPQGTPATLLVLRVFQQDAAVQVLFDRVIERWRLVGRTVLIAGTDLLSRTIDPDDVFTFLNGRLNERFIGDAEQLWRREDAMRTDPDPDGRYRVEECYCHDNTWQLALNALVGRADIVLMDLRGFQAHNQGCRHELTVLAAAGHLQRVVVLVDGHTDRATAEADAVSAPAGRFVWVTCERLDERGVRVVVAALAGE
ncbi:MAG: hypothetical protein KF871_18360 [Hydrogenophaga sp.]|uniref:hypothetical protein n=1 Tax=Hydrogenophaga sp. TaxID=1904254 RepID=UPI001D9779AE|nr:hypothetical protein [Hydrogenophaga sp.]MBX3611861.1 hypothetical protein [Hydrogenophaga sp.]